MILMILQMIAFVALMVLLYCNITKFLHVFQQSFYHVEEFFHSLKTSRAYLPNWTEILLCVVALGMVMVSSSFWKYVGIVAIVLCTLLRINQYRRDKKNVKKKFVITTRVKLTYGACLLLCVLVCFGIYSLSGLEALLVSFAFSKWISMILVLVGNVVIFPILTWSNNKYIKEAKQIIKESPELKVIGITGSYGKTSTKNIITGILENKYSTVMTPKSYNTTLGVVKTIREEIKPYTQVFVCEMGATRIKDIQKICEIVPPDISVITAIGSQHLATFKTMENIVQGKFEIIKYAKKGAKAVLNMDNSWIASHYQNYIQEDDVISYAIHSQDKSISVQDIHMDENGSNFTVILKGEKIEIETKLLGKHNIYNILCGIAVAKELGMEKEEIQKAVKKLRPIPHRLELKNMGGILALDDSFNSNPEGSKMAIECLCMFQERYKVLVTPGMVELGSKEYELNKKLGEYATKCDFVLLVGRKTTQAIQEGMDSLGYQKYKIVENLYEAFEVLTKMKEEYPNLLALFENDLPDCYS